MESALPTEKKECRLVARAERGRDTTARARDTARPASMSAALGLMGVPPSDDLEASWDAAVDAAVSVVARVRAGVAATAAGPSDARAAADLVAALEEATASVTFDEEFVAALGVANGHDLLMRLVSHPDESVAAAAAGASARASTPCPQDFASRPEAPSAPPRRTPPSTSDASAPRSSSDCDTSASLTSAARRSPSRTSSGTAASRSPDGSPEEASSSPDARRSRSARVWEYRA